MSKVWSMWLYTFPESGKWRKGRVIVNKDKMINGTIPFEDIGDCLLSRDDVSIDAAFNDWANATGN